jgi:short-subunit dehydrogenase
MAGEFFAKVIHINLIGTFLCDKAAAALMQHNVPGPDGERGLLIHTSSVAAFEGQIGQAAYAASGLLPRKFIDTQRRHTSVAHLVEDQKRAESCAN